MPRLKPRLLVVGSLNVDLVAAVPRIPRPGETIFASEIIQRFGGKGANQALAAARQGADVHLIGAVGDDEHGRAYRERWRKFKLDDSGIATVPRTPTGAAFIAVDERGENQIIVNAGANAHVTPALVRAHRRFFEGAAGLLLQGEVPIPAILEAMQLAQKHGVAITFNPSPWPDGFPWGRFEIDSLIVNEHEARLLYPRAAIPLSESAYARWRRRLDQLKTDALVLTRGANPTVVVSHVGLTKVPTLPVDPVDTVGAGDSFAGAYAAAAARGKFLPARIKLANAAGALATLKRGAQEAIPTLSQVERALAKASPR